VLTQAKGIISTKNILLVSVLPKEII